MQNLTELSLIDVETFDDSWCQYLKKLKYFTLYCSSSITNKGLMQLENLIDLDIRSVYAITFRGILSLKKLKVLTVCNCALVCNDESFFNYYKTRNAAGLIEFTYNEINSDID